MVLLLGQTRMTAARVDFNREIRSILSNKCFACHGPDEEERKAGLRLDTQEGAFRDMKGHAAIVSGKPERSELINRIATSDADDLMPPPDKGQRLTEQEVRLIRDWIAQGADYATHWSYTPVNRPEPPPLAQGETARNPIDHFALRKLRENGLRMSPSADRWTLARRAAIDLTGLPPSISELEEFVGDQHPEAFSRYVDKLLAKDAFGEHWAGMWLDLARYADSAGYPSDPGREIWAYRDWVIKAFNDNLPFDQFTIDQIAGDLLPTPTPDNYIATAFHRNTMTQNEGGTSDEEFRNEAVIDRVNTTMSVWMGTSMACAQCHTHKFDPITQHEYFQFFAILNNTADADKKDESPLYSFFTEEQKAQQATWKREIESINSRLANPTPDALAGLAGWTTRLSKPLKWTTPTPSLARTQKGTKLTVQDDSSILASEAEDVDTYTIEIPLADKALSAVRIETLPSASLPKNGPGLSDGGNFVINRISAQIVPDSRRAREGRFLRVSMSNGKNSFLHLAEVQVFSGKENVALKGVASQSGDYADAVASRAIDGNTDGEYKNGSVSHSAGESKEEWWEVQLPHTTAVDRVTIWNRTDGGTASRLKDFTIALLDEDRRTVWSSTEKSGPAVSKEFAVNGPIPVRFKSAIADFEQDGFHAASTISDPPTKTDTGWAVGGQTGKAHELSLLTDEAYPVPEGSKLRLSLRQTSKYPKHLVGRFRLSATADANAATMIRIPQPVLSVLHKAESARSEAEQREIRDYYLRNIAPGTRKDRDRLTALERSFSKQKKTTVPVMRELDDKMRRETRVQIRGNYQNLADKVLPGLPSAFNPSPEDSEPNRLSLARWLVAKGNPLTARVTVNRFWERLFGVGIVSTSEEFGSQGELPSHPELLDWLASEFMESGWDTKRLLKLIVTSAAWSQSSKASPELLSKDPENRLLARGPCFRATGEVLRDQGLFVGGILSPKLYGEPVRPVRPNLGLKTAFGGNNDWIPSTGEDLHRRSIYTLVKRNSPYPSFTTFDAPSREVCTLRRSRSNTPLQAFVTLNDPVFVEAAQAFSRRILSEGGGTDDERLRFAFLASTSRPIRPNESARLKDLLKQARVVYSTDAELARQMATEPLGKADNGADIPELASWTTVASVILNLDEMIMRR
ncbi:MAG: DUF1553 domain-containing protein [Verrucomicrobiae bacterium]|nr:DUF1553 domain-containing protein [Verrucomicrobiae bacterium]